jgi:hypothetical protein
MERLRRSDFFRLRTRLGLSPEQTAELCGVSCHAVDRWDRTGAPQLVMRYLLLWDRKYVGYQGWDGFCFSRGKLLYRGKLLAGAEQLRDYPALLERMRVLEAASRRRSFWEMLRHVSQIPVKSLLASVPPSIPLQNGLFSRWRFRSPSPVSLVTLVLAGRSMVRRIRAATDRR